MASSDYPDDVTEIPNPNFYFGTNDFELENGDCYTGGFCAHKKGLVWREGQGTYTTKDGHIYEGLWENDQLLNSDETKVTYPTGAEYYGSVVNSVYSGSGIYILENKLKVTGNFVDNHPVGEVILTDPQNHFWRGDVNDDHAILRPENQFYFNIPKDRGKGKKIKSSEEVESEPKSMKSSDSCIQDLKKIVFKKSLKTKNDFRDTLGSEEKTRTVIIHKHKSTSRKAKSGSNIELLKTFLSSDYRNSCPPVRIFTPTDISIPEGEPE